MAEAGACMAGEGVGKPLTDVGEALATLLETIRE